MEKRELRPQGRLLTAAVAVGLILLSPMALLAQSGSRSAGDQSLRHALQSRVLEREGPDADQGDTRASIALVDLDGDGQTEAITLVSGRAWCGTGGCSLWVLRREAGGWRMVGQTATVLAPVRVLDTRSLGWRDIGVTERFDAVQRGPAVWRFDGGRYPLGSVNSTAATPSGRIVIAADDPGLPLFP